jgi:hypothetical protein
LNWGKDDAFPNSLPLWPDISTNVLYTKISEFSDVVIERFSTYDTNNNDSKYGILLVMIVPAMESLNVWKTDGFLSEWWSKCKFWYKYLFSCKYRWLQ